MNEVSWWSRCWRSCRPWAEVVFRRLKLHCGPRTEVVSHATPPLLKVKINFDVAQKLSWKEIKFFYGLIRIITSNDTSELLKMQLESRSRFHAEEHQRQPYSIVGSRYKVIIVLSSYFSSGAPQPTVHTSIIEAKKVSLNFFFSSSNISVRTWGSFEQKQQTNPVSTKCRQQTADRIQNTD